MSNTIALRRHIEQTPVRIGPAGLDAAFRAFVEGLGGRPPRREAQVEVIPARRCDPTRAEIIAASYLGAPVALSPLDTIAEDQASRGAATRGPSRR